MHHAYKRVNTADDELGAVSTRSPSIFRNQKTLLVLKDILLATLALYGLISMVYNFSHYHNTTEQTASHAIPRQSCYCGKSTVEARGMGCKYDSLSAAWLPEHCRDDELTAEFEQLGDGPDGNWQYWADKQRTTLLTLEQVAELGNDPNATFHMSGQWHVIHCFFFWRREHRSRFNGKFIEGRSDTEKHILHCQQVITNPQFATVSGVSLDADALVFE